MEKRWKIIGTIALVVTLALLFLPKVVPICTDMVATAMGGQMPMRCYYTFQAQSLFALTALLVSGTFFVVKSNDARKGIGFTLAVLGVMMLILPLSGVSGICRLDHMPCHNTAFWNRILSSVLIALGLLVIFLKGSSHVNSSTKEEEQGARGDKMQWLD